MQAISESVVKKDHEAKMSGRSLYVSDYPSEGVLTGKVLRSTVPAARIVEVKVPDLPEGYYYVDKDDVPGKNAVAIFLEDTPVFAEGTVSYVGDPIGMFCGPDEEVLIDLIRRTDVVYDQTEAVFDLDDATEAFFEYSREKGDVEAAFAEADEVFEDEVETHHQEQAYLEVQGMMAEPDEDGSVWLHGSMQCIYYVQNAVEPVLGCGREGVHVMQDVTGGGFGGKEDYPSVLGCQVAVACKKIGKPVRCVLDRREDMACTSKRHPLKARYRAAIKDGRVTAIDVDLRYNGGGYSTLSAVVLQRGLISCSGVYDIPNQRVHGRALKTNTVPNGAFRGFGGPQVFFSIEMFMDHVAQHLGVDTLEFRKAHMVKKGDDTSTMGKYHFEIPLNDMIAELDEACDYSRKRAEYAKPQTGRYRRGIGMSLFFHGAGFTGNGERDFIKAVVKLHKHADGTIEILAANGEIGQGLRTTFPKIVAKAAEVPLDKVYFDHPDSARVPDSGPTVASRSIMATGELLRRAGLRLREEWVDGEDQIIEEHYKHPEFLIPFDITTFTGDAYPTFAWGANCVEVEVDTLTGITEIVNAHGAFDLGTPIDYNIVVGQMEGGFLQGLGYGSIESMDADGRGRIPNASFSDYLIPTANDVPNLTATLHEAKYPSGPFGAKGGGELPCVGAAPAYVQAMEQALDTTISKTPFGPQDVIETLARKATA